MDVVADVTSYGQLHATLRARIASLGLSREEVGARAGVADGYASKVLAPYPGRRITLELWLAFARAAGLKLVLVEDDSPGAPAAILTNGRYGPVEMPDPRTLMKEMVRRELRRHCRKASKKAAAARMVKISPAKRRAIARNAIRTRWRRVRMQRKSGSV